MSPAYGQLVLCGEVDHGKSTLAGRLLLESGSLPLAQVEKLEQGARLAHLVDQFTEEQSGDCTIDTTQAFLRLPRGGCCRLIDTPGHLDWLRNMISGATQATVAVLVVDALQGVRPQTLRHARILALLGVRSLIVAVNKMDLAGHAREAFERVREALIPVGPDFARMDFVPISAEKGCNVARPCPRLRAWHRGPALLRRIREAAGASSPSAGPLRLPVQAVDEANGLPVAVGPVLSGRVERGQTLRLLPEGIEVTVRGVLLGLRRAASCQPGRLAGLVFDARTRLRRGQVLAPANNAPAVLRRFAARILWLEEKPFVPGRRLTLQCATQSVRVELRAVRSVVDPGAWSLQPHAQTGLRRHELGLCELGAAAPLVMDPFERTPELGRFILEENGRLLGLGIFPAPEKT